MVPSWASPTARRRRGPAGRVIVYHIAPGDGRRVRPRRPHPCASVAPPRREKGGHVKAGLCGRVGVVPSHRAGPAREAAAPEALAAGRAADMPGAGVDIEALGRECGDRTGAEAGPRGAAGGGGRQTPAPHGRRAKVRGAGGSGCRWATARPARRAAPSAGRAGKAVRRTGRAARRRTSWRCRQRLPPSIDRVGRVRPRPPARRRRGTTDRARHCRAEPASAWRGRRREAAPRRPPTDGIRRAR